MAYQALYRVWRSQRFDDVVGQKAITQTLKNAIVQKKTSHAYLFTGPRGTGKTSAAKIFAKAINCKHSQDGEPCNVCETCVAITEGRLNDVIEIDAASNNGVEEIRDIRDKAKYAPTQAEYKVYIIDEVHMLSTGAFNALLKTLEEPPQNVIFILATTEPHKIPLTIISRTQRFDFKRISTQDIVDHMAHIMQEMALDYEEQALYVIGRAAEGGMRDALSILDQTISFSDEKVTLEDAMQVTGSLTYEMMDHYIQCCVAGDVERALEGLESILGEGKEARRFLEDLLLYCRDLLMYQQAPKLLAEKAGTLTEAFKELATQTPAEKIYQLIQILSDTQNEIRFTNNANIYLEVATVKLAKTVQPNKHNTPETANQDGSAEGNPELADLQNQIGQLKKELAELKKHGVAGKEADAPRQQARPQAPKSSFRVPTERVYQVLNEATRTHLMNVKNVWEDLLQTLSVTQRAMLKASEPVAASPKGIVVAFDYEIVCARATDDEEMQLAFNNNLSRLMDYTPEMVCITRESWPKLRQSFINQNQGSLNHSEPENEMARLADEPPVTNEHSQENPVVDEAIAMFGEELVEVLDD
ncbi:TPA: DNA polymerase III subunit gamma/tau [Enterococcus faecalis]|uniref:DNA polymerase III subunit gamma/tau n=1 Tax=Enterococcus faecalis TaxID=1351 RepID=UPI00032E6429|nr:DNA polymerase III subunit gamma/tau [Enterococcus faecalis]EOI10255.1 DNA polymerase III, subunit gamma and tau [Enterococcus faecalis EnGen0244]EOI89820.1 DNA polymerase III, subunit gamma and tau [Enterococcus faecalis EnGen0298]EOJ90097.1 DNA polymerase III, subunit gamma and tau [Enterococcus faecalis EnGen0370]EOL55421.1 DNA polymerase III, subunit gamma and tau [Enterococcus faecalis EnGen0245]HAP4062388.1 DNA polymerase III subunit gamma/tau [Enterococcus faecalis]